MASFPDKSLEDLIHHFGHRWYAISAANIEAGD
jgi:hypothetical protein